MGRLKDYFKKNPFLLAHHPSCEYFSEHTLNFRGWRLCLGCFIIYPTAMVAILALYVASQFVQLSFEGLFIGSVILFSINLIRKFVFKDRLKKNVQIVFRMIMGLSLSFIIASIWLAPNPYKLYILIALILVGVVYNLFNGRKYLGTCKECPQYHKFPKCEGLGNSLE